MSDRKPIYVGRDPSSGIVSGLTEFKTGDTVPLEHGGTGVTSLGALSSLLGIPELYTPNDHGSLDGLGDDDHPQYVLSSTNADLSSSVLGVSSTVFDNSASWTGGGGVTDHGALTGLADDDHPQYVLSATNLALSSAVSTLEGELDGVSSTVFDNSASWAVDTDTTDHTALTNIGTRSHAELDGLFTSVSTTSGTWDQTATDLDTHEASATVHFTEASIDHGSIAGLGDNDHPQYVLSATNQTLSSTVSNLETELDGVSSTVFDNSASWGTDTDTTDHTLLSNIGTRTHSELDGLFTSVSTTSGTWDQTATDLDTHEADATIHFTEASIDHGSITGLADDDHPQYVLSATNQTLSSTVTTLETELDGVSSTVFDNSAAWAVDTDTTDHTSLTNIGTRTHAELDGLYTSVNTTSGTWDQTATDLDSHEADTTIHFTEASIDHGSIAGLGDNDHPQYVLSATNQALSSTVSTLETELDGVSSTVFDNSASWGGAGVTDHGALTGLADDDHPQYVLSATNQTLSSTVSTLEGELDGVSSTVFDNSASWAVDTDTTDHTALSNIGTRTHAELDSLYTSVNSTSGTWDQTATDLDSHEASATVHFTEASIDHGSIAGLGDDDHTQYTLVDGSRSMDTLDVTGNATVDGNVGIGVAGTPTAPLQIEGVGTADAIYIESSDTGADAGPVITLKRDSASPASADYLGQLKFKGESDTGAERVYAKITAKIDDPANTVEDGIIEFMNRFNGSEQIALRLKENSFRTLNGVELHVDGNTGLGNNNPSEKLDVTGNIKVSGTVDGRDIAADGTKLDTVETDLLGVSGTVFDNSGAWGTDTDTTDHTALTNIGTRTHAELDSLYTSVNTTSGTWDQTATDLDTHEADSTIHFTEASIDHGSIAGLADNDHPQYVLSATNQTLSSTVSTLEGELDGVSSTVFDNSAAWGVDTDTTDHTALSNIGTRTHPELDGLYTSVFDNSATWDTVTTVSGDLDTLEVTVAAATAIINAMSAALDGVSATVFDSSGGWEIETKAITIESPTSTEDISMFFTDVAITVEKMTAVLRGSATPSVTWTIRHGSDRSAAGTEVVTGGTATTNTTTGDTVTSFNDATIPANSFVWLETTAQSGTVNEINITIKYGLD